MPDLCLLPLVEVRANWLHLPYSSSPSLLSLISLSLFLGTRASPQLLLRCMQMKSHNSFISLIRVTYMTFQIPRLRLNLDLKIHG